MELEILRLLYDYTRAGRLVDKKYIEKLTEIVVKRRTISDYVQKIIYTDCLSKDDYSVSCAAYGMTTGELIIDYEAIQMSMEFNTRYDCLFNQFEQLLYKNLTITQYILHELEHAYQNKKTDDKNDKSIEAKLIKASFMIEMLIKNPKFRESLANNSISKKELLEYIKLDKELYRQYYELNPSERFAEIYSYDTLLKVLEPIKEHTPNMYEFITALKLENMLRGYETAFRENGCPTEVYLNGTGNGIVWRNLDFYSKDRNELMEKVQTKYDLPKRLTLGLPITYKEYDHTDAYLHSLNKYY